MTVDGGTFRYAGGGEIDPKLVHDDHAYVGYAFTPPKGATSVTVTVNGGEPEELDLAEDGDFVLDGVPIEYFAFALSGGGTLGRRTWVVDFTWHLPGGDVPSRKVVRRV